ncbi:MAG TPA: DUF1553 domain-containing protein, partial [Planctomycetaceae bacterium]|nr:DUF1553 domain-containing protein [Planctomycetaceae bacterium]
RKVYFLSRGNETAKQGLASPGFLQVLMTGEDGEKQWTIDRSGEQEKPQESRIALADWLVDTDAGAGHLLARVIVNRLWQHYLGRGIVSTPSDFGSQGVRPTHPELLDFLATRLIESGWQLKPIHKLIVQSATYRQANEETTGGLAHDPDNRLFWRQPPRRVEAEIVRDTLLAVSGSLDLKMYGPGSLDQNDPRRSVYLKVKRSVLIPFLQLFDAPDAMQSIGERSVTTVPPQALAMMNSPFVRGLAEKFAKRVRPSAEVPLPQTIDNAYKIALAREPSELEKTTMLQFIEQQAASYGENPQATDVAIADFCQLMFCLNEFLFVD